jgi:hypothetical protein
MHDLTTFEQRLAARLDAELSRALPGLDASGIAAAAMVRRNLWDRLLNRVGAGLGLPMRAARRIAIIAVAALLVLATLALALALGTVRPGARTLAYIDTSGDVVIANADGSDPRVVSRVELSPLVNNVLWAPGGGRLATFGESWTLRIIKPTGEVTFAQKLEDRSSQFAWSNDGARLAVLDGAWVHDAETVQAVVDPHLSIVSADGTIEGATDLPVGYRYTVGQGGITWSPDGSRLAITGFDATVAPAGTSSSIWIVDRATLQAREIVPPGSLSYDIDPVWLPDGRILFSRLNGGIWQVDPDTEAASQVFAPQCPCSGATLVPFAASPDGTRLALIAPNVDRGDRPARAPGLQVLDLGTGDVIDINLPEGFGGSGPIGWTPDGLGLTTRFGPITDQPFYGPDFAIIDIATGATRVIASDVIALDLQPR